MHSVYERALEKDFKKEKPCFQDVLFLQLDRIDAIYAVENSIYFKMVNSDLHKVLVP